MTRVFGKGRVLLGETESLPEALPQAPAVVQRAAEKQHLPADASALSKSRDGLIDHRLIDGRGDVLLPRPLIEERLDVRLGEHPAPGGDGVYPGVIETEPVQLADGNVEQRRHLVDKRAGPSGAGAVHPLVDARAEKDDLRVLAAQLDRDIGLRKLLLQTG